MDNFNFEKVNKQNEEEKVRDIILEKMQENIIKVINGDKDFYY
mgnify:CR=1 FL=1|jgi:hypothetical protein